MRLGAAARGVRLRLGVGQRGEGAFLGSRCAPGRASTAAWEEPMSQLLHGDTTREDEHQAPCRSDSDDQGAAAAVRRRRLPGGSALHARFASAGAAALASLCLVGRRGRYWRRTPGRARQAGRFGGCASSSPRPPRPWARGGGVWVWGGSVRSRRAGARSLRRRLPKSRVAFAPGSPGRALGACAETGVAPKTRVAPAASVGLDKGFTVPAGVRAGAGLQRRRGV